ncbi:MAG: hypothetical protein WBZ16_17455 [Pseudolabrys sp.]
MNSENPVASVITLGKNMLQNARKQWAELLDGPSTRTALVILVLGVATLFYSCVTI